MTSCFVVKTRRKCNIDKKNKDLLQIYSQLIKQNTQINLLYESNKDILFMSLYRVLNVVYVTNLKYDVFTKMRSYISSGVDLLFYITGINLKTIFSRKKTDTSEAYDESIILPLPTTPEEAVRHLLFQTEDKPFR